MKKIFYVLFLGIFTFQYISAQDTEEVKVDDKNAPEITFEKTTHDYGTIVKGANGECEFVFTNTGKDPLILNNVRSSCGCTVPSWPKEPVKKKKTGTIKVKYNTSRVGVINKSITVYSNAKNATVRLKITGNVVEKLGDTHDLTPYQEKEKEIAVPRVDNDYNTIV